MIVEGRKRIGNVLFRGRVGRGSQFIKDGSWLLTMCSINMDRRP